MPNLCCLRRTQNIGALDLHIRFCDAKATYFLQLQAFLTKIWWGDMSTNTQILKLICGFWCPFLIYTNLIAFRYKQIFECKR